MLSNHSVILNNTMQDPSVLLLTGETGTGKTTVLKNILRELKTSGVNTGGMLAPGRYLASGEKEFDLELIPGEEKYSLSSRIEHTRWEAIGGFWFNPEAVEAGLRHLRSLSHGQYDLYLLDEIGPFELEGLLWAPAIPELINTCVPMIWTVRASILEKVCRKWGLHNPMIVTKTEGIQKEPTKQIHKWLREHLQASS
ncbi:nucleoside-triphosphatase [Bacteroidota bacterium]